MNPARLSKDPLIDPTLPIVGITEVGDCFRFPLGKEHETVLFDQGVRKTLRMSAIALFKFVERTIDHWHPDHYPDLKKKLERGKRIELLYSSDPPMVFYLPLPEPDGERARAQITWGNDPIIVDILATYVLRTLLFYVEHSNLKLYYDASISMAKANSLRSKISLIQSVTVT
jgi:hypothetical protein